MVKRRKQPPQLLLVLGAVALLVLMGLVVWFWEVIRDPRRLFVDDGKYSTEIAAAARKHRLDPALVRAVIYQESGFDPFKRGKAGEIGLMQVLPSGAAAEWARVNKRPRPADYELFDVGLNLEIGCWYLARALDKWSQYDHRLELALAQYNAGAKRARRWAPPDKRGEVLPRVDIASTKRYIMKIMERYYSYRVSAQTRN